ncbi:MAG: carotenoid biosynthesis protein, partial [Thermomicrobium sp.]
AYFGMPVINFFGWALTGLTFFSISRFLWRTDLPITIPTSLPFAIYTANMFFAVALCALVGLWLPIFIATLFGVVPAILSTLPYPRNPSDSLQHGSSPRDHQDIERVAWRVLRTLARLTLLGRRYHGQGMEQIPPQGPVILAAQHIHHLDDGRLLLALVPRPLRFLVALDWVPSLRWRSIMETLCRLAGWPVIVRPDELTRATLVYRFPEAQGALVRGLREAYSRLCQGQALVVFPEGYPLIDPHLPGRRQARDTLYEGAVWLAQRTAKALRTPIPVVPIRFLYHPDGSILVQASPPIWVPADGERSLFQNQLAVILREPFRQEAVPFRSIPEGRTE